MLNNNCMYTQVSNDFSSDIRRYNQFIRKTCIKNENDFRSCCNALDALLGYSKTSQSFNQIILDKKREQYIGIIEMIMRNTRLTIHELSVELNEIVKETRSTTRTKKNETFRIDNIVNVLIKWLRYPKHEPKWHMLKRGDTRELPNRNGCDLWGYLLKLYTDPEYCRVIQPDYVKKHGLKFAGYMELVNKARRDGQKELKRRYGPDTDLTMRPQKRTRDAIDETNRANFITIIRNGTIASDIADESRERRVAKQREYAQRRLNDQNEQNDR